MKAIEIKKEGIIAPNVYWFREVIKGLQLQNKLGFEVSTDGCEIQIFGDNNDMDKLLDKLKDYPEIRYNKLM